MRNGLSSDDVSARCRMRVAKRIRFLTLLVRVCLLPRLAWCTIPSVMSFKVLCAGFVCADLVLRPVHDLPPPGGNRFVEDATLFIGGCAANAAVAFARLGLDVVVAGRVGDDPLRPPGAPGLARRTRTHRGTAHNDKGDNSHQHRFGDQPGRAQFLRLSWRVRALIPPICPMLCWPASITCIWRRLAPCLAWPARPLQTWPAAPRSRSKHQSGRHAESAARHGGRRGASSPARGPVPAECGRGAGGSGRWRIDTLLDRGLARGVRLMGIKQGERGCSLATARERLHTAAFAVPAIDTVGAGDAWSAALVFGWHKGWPLAEIGRFANAAGALCTLASGGTAWHGRRVYYPPARWPAIVILLGRLCACPDGITSIHPGQVQDLPLPTDFRNRGRNS